MDFSATRAIVTALLTLSCVVSMVGGVVDMLDPHVRTSKKSLWFVVFIICLLWLGVVIDLWWRN